MSVPISNVTRRVVYVASGTGPYNFTFEILSNTDVAVYRDDTLLALTTDYSVTINSNGTGYVTLAATPTGAAQIAIVGDRTIQRMTDFVTGGDFFANTVNDEMDQQTIFAQQNAEGLQRALQAPQTDPTNINMILPRASVRAGKYLGFDTSGNPIVDGDIPDVVYYGPQTSTPTTRPNGTAMEQGDLYLDAAASIKQIKFFDGTAWRSQFYPEIIAMAALDVNCSLSTYFRKTISSNSTFTFSNAPSGYAFAFTLELTHTSGTVTWPASVRWTGNAAPTLTSPRVHLFTFLTDDGGSSWRGAYQTNYAS
jgi:hypothetical protein